MKDKFNSKWVYPFTNSIVLVSTMFVAMAGLTAKAQNSAEVKPKKMTDYTAVLPRGKTLPEGVLRVWVPYSKVNGSEEFNSKGKKVKIGADISAIGSAAVLEYGLSEGMSFQLVVPYYLQQQVNPNASDALEKAMDENFVTLADAQKAKVALALQQASLCTSVDSCMKLKVDGTIAGALQLTNTVVGLPLGKVVEAGVTAAIESQVDAAVAAGEQVKDGETDVGDIQIGVLKEIHTDEKILVAVGAGIRFPTGSFSEADVVYGTGRGTTDFGVRTNFDYGLSNNLIFSWEHYAELMVAAGEKKYSDGSSKKFERAGVVNKGLLDFGYNVGEVHPSLKAVGLNLGYAYNYDGENRYDDVAEKSRSELTSADVSLSINGLDYGIPGSLSVTSSTPLSGKNSQALNSNGLVMKGYYKF